MKIAIKIVSTANRNVDGPRAVFGPSGGTIGRRSDMTLVIPDKSRRVSRVHAIVTFHNGQFRIRDQGSFLPVYVNGHGVGYQRDMTIHPGDRIQIGDYGFLVAHADALGEDTGTAPAEATTDAPLGPPPQSLTAISAAAAYLKSRPEIGRVAPKAPQGAGPDTFALLEKRLESESRDVPYPDISMYRDVPEAERAVPIRFDATATQGVEADHRAVAPAGKEAERTARVAPPPAPAAPEPSPAAAAEESVQGGDIPAHEGYVIPIRKRRRRA